MRSWKLWILIIVLLLGMTPQGNSAHAQTVDKRIQFLRTIRSDINAAVPSNAWSFDIAAGQVFSIQMQSASGDLEPFAEILDSTGTVVAQSTITSYRNATIDSFTAPKAETYTVRVSSTQPGMSGTYALLLLPGYSFLLVNDGIQNTSVLRAWQEPNAASTLNDGRLKLQLDANNYYTWTTAEKLGMFKDVYVQVDVQPDRFNNYWEYGIVMRAILKNGFQTFYTFFINSENEWRAAIAEPQGLKIIQDWTLIRTPITQPATFGVLSKDIDYTLFINGVPVGSMKNSTLTEPGAVGVSIGTGAPPDNFVSVFFDNFVVTLPSDSPSVSQFRVPPSLDNWQRSQQSIIDELVAKRLVPGEGRPVVDLNEAFVTNNTEGGIVFVPLARNETFTNLVYTADIRWESNSSDIACALEFRATSTDNFTIVYFDRKGGYGIRQALDKDGIVVSEYNTTTVIDTGNLANNRLMLVAIGNGLLIYINGQLVSNTNVRQSSGGIYLASYNYNLASSFCQFKNIWVRSFDQ